MIISLDNGVTGYLTIMKNNGEVIYFDKVPSFKTLSYTKMKQYITRINVIELKSILEKAINENKEDTPIKVCMERPMINPVRFKSSVSAIRALEAEIIACELVNLPIYFIDSKEWQKVMLPAGLNKNETKKASDEVAKRIFPQFSGKIKNGTGDSLLMAEYFRKKKL